MLVQKLGLRAFWVILGLTILFGFVGSVLLPHDPYIRYQAMKGTIFERAKWIYERTHFDETPIDILFIGSSRTARGVITPALEQQFDAYDHPKHIANFSLPASGLDIRYAIARDVLTKRDVDMVVISLVEQFPRDGHQAFADLATASEILSSPWVVNRRLPANLARLPIRQIQLAAASAIPDAFGYQVGFDPETYVGTSVDPRVFNPGDPNQIKSEADIASLEEESAYRRRVLTRPILPESLADIEFGIPRSYIRRIAALADKTDTELVFLYLPFYGGFERPFEQDWLEQFGPVLSADFLRLNPENYNDVAHLSDTGAQKVTPWLTDQLIPLLEQRDR